MEILRSVFARRYAATNRTALPKLLQQGTTSSALAVEAFTTTHPQRIGRVVVKAAVTLVEGMPCLRANLVSYPAATVIVGVSGVGIV